MSAISLESSIRTCKVDTAYANKIESDRFLNPNNMVCPIWNGVDLTGREACPDSFWTKRAGCNSATDRVVVENSVSRPQYMEYITLNSNGINGNIYGNTTGYKNSMLRTNDLKNVHNITGQYGNVTGFGAEVYPSCGYGAYRDAMSQEAQQSRQRQSVQNYFEGYQKRSASGFKR